MTTGNSEIHPSSFILHPSSRPVLILGATSTIARHVAASLARRGYALYLAGRNMDELARIAADITSRYNVPVKHSRFDADDFSSHPALVENVVKEMGGLYGVVYAAGYQGTPQPDAAKKGMDATLVIGRNLTGAVSVLELCAAYLEAKAKTPSVVSPAGGDENSPPLPPRGRDTERGSTGFILGISSVAGDRGRQSNYIYGASKSGLHTYLQGLRHRMSKAGVRVVSVKPGLVDTPMTAGMKRGPLMASPVKAGERIARATERGPTTVYVPFFWRYIMLIIRNVPERIFHKTKL